MINYIFTLVMSLGEVQETGEDETNILDGHSERLMRPLSSLGIRSLSAGELVGSALTFASFFLFTACLNFHILG